MAKKNKIIALFQPGKDSAQPKCDRPIFLLKHVYKLLEHLLLDRLSPHVEQHFTKDQAGFQPGKSTFSQLLT